MLLALLLVARLALAITLPWFLDRWAKPLGLACTYERLDISLLQGRIELWQLVLEPLRASETKAAGDPRRADAAQRIADEVVHLEYATVEVDLGSLLHAAFKLDRVEIDGLELHAVRDAGGQLNLQRYFGSTAPTEATEAVRLSPPASEIAAPLHLTPPIAISAVRLQRVRVHYEDPHVTPPIDARLDLDLSASDIGSKVRPLHVELTALSPENLGSVFVEGNCTGDDLALHADLDVAVEVFRPRAFNGYLETIGISPFAKQISFKLHAAADVALQGKLTNEARTTLMLRDLVLSDDLEEALALDALECTADSISTERAHVARIEITGLRAAAGRLSSGALRFAGIDFLPGDGAMPPPTPTPGVISNDTGDAAPYPWLIDQLLVHKGAARFKDAAVEPHADLTLELDELEIDHLTTTAAEATQPISVHAVLHAPHTAANAHIDGEIALFSVRKTVNLSLGADHITLEAIAPYLRAAHLASDLKSGTLAFKLSGTAEESLNGITRGRLELDDFRLSDADEVCAIDRMALEDLLLDPTRSLLRLGRIEIAGTRGGFERDADLALHFLGLRTLPPQVPIGAPASARARSDADVPAPPATLPSATSPTARSRRYEIGTFVWHDATLRYSDRALEPALTLTLADAKAEAHELSFGGQVDDAPGPPADINLLLHAPGIAERLECTATIQSRPGPVDLAYSVEVKGEGIRAGELSPYLLDQGIDSKLDRAEFAMKCEGSVKSEADGIALEFSLDHARLLNQDESLASIDSLHVRDARILPNAIRIDEVSIENPRAAVARDATGALILGGMRFVASTPPKPRHKAPPSIFQPLLQPLIDLLTKELAGKEFILDRVRLSGTDVHWQDASVSPPVDVHALIGLRADGFVMGKAAPAAKIALDLALPGALEKLDLAGTLSLAPKDWSADLSLDAHGIQAGPLAAYLPPHVASDLHEASLALQLQAAVGTEGASGARVDLDLHDLLYRSGNAADPLFKLGSLVLRVPRADPEARVFTIDEVSLGGVECTVRRDAGGNLHCLGFTLESTSSHPSPNASAVQNAPALTLASGPPAPLASPDAVSDSDTINVTWQTPPPPPTVNLGKLDLGIDKLTFIDETHAGGAVPLVGSIHLSSDHPMVLIDANPAGLKPIHFDVRGTLEPIARELELGLDLSPWTDEPSVSGRLAVRGLRGESLIELAPELAPRVDGRGMTEGEISGSLQAQFSMERRGPTSFDFKHSFGIHFALEDLALRDRPGGSILAGLDALSVSADRIVPATGDIHITSIELINPRGVLHKEADGLHVLGLIVKPVPAQPAEPSAAEPAPEAASESATTAVPPPSRPPFVVRVDQLLVSGIDVDIRDDSVAPPMVLPLVDLELTVNHFTSRMLAEPIPVHFSAFLAAGDIALPERERQRGSWVRRMTELPGVSTVTSFVSGSGGGEPQTARPAFEELTVSGVASMRPRLSGSITTALRGVELLNFAGLAERSKFTINDGILDANVKLDIDPRQGASVRSMFRFSDLSLSEEIGGPIQRYLLLPAPLNQVLFVLRDANGDQVVPLSFEVQGADVSGSQITRAAVSTFSGLVAKAIADAPLRILTWIGSWFGIGAGKAAELEKEARSFRFDPGAAGLSSAAQHDIQPLIELLKSDSDTMLVVHQELGAGDVARAEVLANPTPEECLEVVARLRHGRDELLRKSDELHSRASALWSVGRENMASDASVRLRDVSRQVGETEKTLDRMLDLVRPGAERLRDRRTRQACRAIGEQRIASLREILAQSGVKDVAARIEVRSLRPEPTAGEGGGRITLVPRLRGTP